MSKHTFGKLLLLLCLFFVPLLSSCAQGPSASAVPPSMSGRETFPMESASFESFPVFTSLPETAPSTGNDPQLPPALSSSEPAYAFPLSGSDFEDFSKRVYLSGEGKIIVSIPPEAVMIQDIFSLKMRYYQIRRDGISYLYDLKGSLLDSAPYAFGAAAGPYVAKGKYGMAFFYRAASYDLINVESGDCPAENIQAIVRLNEGKALVLDEEYRARYLMDKEGNLKDWPGEKGSLFGPIRQGFVILQNDDQSQLMMYDEDGKLIKAFPRKVDVYMSTTVSGSGMPYFIEVSPDTLEIWDIRKDSFFTLEKDSDLYRREGFFSNVNTDGEHIWTVTSLYDMSGKLIASYQGLFFTANPEMPFVASKGETVYILDKTGSVIVQRDIPGFTCLDLYGLKEGSPFIPCMVRTSINKESLYSGGYMILNSRLEELSERVFMDYSEVLPGLLRVSCMDSNGRIEWLLVDDQGKVILRNFRKTGIILSGAAEDVIPVAIGPYIGLIDRKGNWIQKNSIYDIPFSGFFDD